MKPQSTCPETQHLPDLLEGRLPEQQTLDLQEHIETCEACQQTLADLVEGDESVEKLAEHLREPRNTSETALRSAVANVSPPSESETTTGEPSAGSISLDFLDPSDEPGSRGRLAQYEITEVVGRGGMGIVLKAHDTQLDRVVAIKVLAPELAANAGARKRFLREARAAAAVGHDNVVTIFAVDEGRLPYLVMEYIDGQSLRQKIDREGHLELKEILRIGMQVAAGLAAAHAQGLIHRDVKPSNILLQNSIERVQITDFGLARAVDDVGITRTGEVAGTPEYMSPEQADGGPVDHRSDLFSLGSVLYAMCTGRSPFRSESTPRVMRRVCEDRPRPIREVNPDVPRWLADLIDKLLAKDPSERLQTAGEVEKLLGSYLAHVQDPTGASLPPPVAPPKWKRRRRPWLLVAVAVLVLAAGLGITETTGVTRLAAAVIRIVTGEGTLVIEVDDPEVSVTIDGRDLVITGAGPKEVRLTPGEYQFRATKDGEPIRDELVTITRGGRRTLSVRVEPPAPEWIASVDRLTDEIELRPDDVDLLLERARLYRDHRKLEQAAADYRRAAEVQQERADRSPEDPEALCRVGQIYAGLDEMYILAGDVEQALEARLKGIAVFEERARRFPDKPYGNMVGLMHWRVGCALLPSQPDEAQHHFNQGVGIATAVIDKFGKRPEERENVAFAHHVLGLLQKELGNNAEALRSLEKAVELAPDRFWARNAMAIFLLYSSDPAFRDSRRAVEHAARAVQLQPDMSLVQLLGAARFNAGEPRPAADATETVPLGLTEIQSCFLLARSLAELGLNEKGHEWYARGLKLLQQKNPENATLDKLRRQAEVALGTDAGELPLDYRAVPEGSITRVRRLAGHTDGITCIRALGQGRRCLTASHDGTVRLWEIHTSGLLKTFTFGAYWREPLAVAPDQQMGATENREGTILLFNLESGEPVRELSGHSDAIAHLEFSADGRRLVSRGRDETLRLWDVESGKELKRFDCGPWWAQAAAFTPDGGKLLYGEGGFIVLWDIETESEVWRAGEDAVPSHVHSIAVSADGRRVATSALGGPIHLRDAVTGKLLGTLVGHSVYSDIAFTPDGRHLVSANSADKTLRVWSVETFSEACRIKTDLAITSHIAVLPDGRHVISGGGLRYEPPDQWIPEGDYDLHLWRLPESVWPKTGHESQGAVAAPPIGEVLRFGEHSWHVWSTAFSPDGRHVLSAGGPDVFLWDVETGAAVRRYGGHGDPNVNGALAVAFSPDGQRFFTGAADGSVRMWDRDTGELLRRFDGQPGWVNFALSRDGRRMVSGGMDHTARIWDVDSGEELLRFTPHMSGIHNVALAPDGRRALSADHDRVVLYWNAETGEILRRFEECNGNVTFHPDGRHALTGVMQSVVLLDLETGREVRRFQGHTGLVMFAVFSPDGRRALSTAKDLTIRLWDVETGDQLARFEGHTDQPTALAFSPDGRLALSGSQRLDGTVRVWALPSAKTAPAAQPEAKGAAKPPE